jgi:hypothetical protein
MNKLGQAPNSLRLLLATNGLPPVITGTQATELSLKQGQQLRLFLPNLLTNPFRGSNTHTHTHDRGCAYIARRAVLSFLPAVAQPGHNISVPLQEQLVVELKGKLGVMALLQWFPSVFISSSSVPLHCHMPPETAARSTHSGVGSILPCSIGRRGGAAAGAVPWKGLRTLTWKTPLMRALWKCETIGNLANALRDMERTCVSWTKLGGLVLHQGVCLFVQHAQTHPSSDYKLTRGDVRHNSALCVAVLGPAKPATGHR